MNAVPPSAVGDVRLLRDIARTGRLAEVAGTAAPALRAALFAAAYEIVWPLVFQRITRPVERRRGHWRCSTAVVQLADGCVDGFHDDVEAVIMDLLTRGNTEIVSVEAWVCARMNAVTVDGHRRRRGGRGALQRPRLPRWLAGELGPDPWLSRLALHILDWVGVPDTAGGELWPLDTWSQLRAQVTGDWQGCDRATVAADVDRVLAAMRRGRPAWYAAYVERPLGAKISPLTPCGDAVGEPRPVRPMTPDDEADARLAVLAATAVDAIGAALRRGGDAHDTVVTVIDEVFASGDGADDLARLPGDGVDWDERVAALFADPQGVERIVAQVVQIVGGGCG